MYQCVAEARDDPDDEIVGSGRGQEYEEWTENICFNLTE